MENEFDRLRRLQRRNEVRANIIRTSNIVNPEIVFFRRFEGFVEKEYLDIKKDKDLDWNLLLNISLEKRLN